MKRLLFMLFMMLFMAGCADSQSDGQVQLDGPILEGVSSEGHLEFAGAVVNTGVTSVKSVFVLIILKDRDGNIIEAISVPVSPDEEDDTIFPSERVFFTVSIDIDSRRIFFKDVELFFEEDLGDAPEDTPEDTQVDIQAEQ